MIIASKLWLVAAAGLVLASAGPSAQTGGGTQGQPTVVRGRVLDALTGSPVRGALATGLVTMSAGGRLERVTAETDAAGLFEMAVPAGRGSASVAVQMPGYAPGHVGQMGPFDTWAAADKIDLPVAGSLTVRLWPQAAVIGFVRDAAGRPVAGAQILPLIRTYTGIGWRWVPARSPVTSDDTGAYRLSDLRLGTYAIAARTAGGASVTYGPSSSGVAGGLQLSVRAGSELALDLSLLPEDAGYLDVAVLSAGGPVGAVEVRVTQVDGADDAAVASERTQVSGADGRVRFSGLQAGLYRVEALKFPEGLNEAFSISGDFVRALTFNGPRPGQSLPPPPAEPTLAASVLARVESEAQGEPAILNLLPAGSISGTVVFDGADAPSGDVLTSIAVEIRPADGRDLGRLPQARIEPGGRFRSAGLPAGRYVIRVNPAPAGFAGWSMTSVTVAGAERLGEALTLGEGGLTDVVVKLTRARTELTGSVSSRPGAEAGAARVIVFPQQVSLRSSYLLFPETRRIRQVFVTVDGRFSVAIPPGDYLVAAVRGTMPEHWMAPEYLQQLAADARSVTIDVGTTAHVNLTLD